MKLGKGSDKRVVLITIPILLIVLVMIIITLAKGVQVKLDNEGISLSGGIFYSADIPYSDIDEVKLLSSIDYGTRTNGVSLGIYHIGKYSNKEYGKYKLFANSNNEVYIEIKYDSTETVVFNCDNDEATRGTYNELISIVR